MELYLELSLYPNVITHVFYAIVLLIAVLAITKVIVVSMATNRPKKEVIKDDNSGNKKRSSKTNVHKSR